MSANAIIVFLGVLAVVAFIMEMLVPAGIFIFIGLSSILTLLLAWLVPGLDPIFLGIFFSIAMVGGVVFFRTKLRYLLGMLEMDAPNRINTGADRLIGTKVTVIVAIKNGEGRVKVGDSEWRAKGPDCNVGDYVVIDGHESGVTLLVSKVAE